MELSEFEGWDEFVSLVLNRQTRGRGGYYYYYYGDQEKKRRRK